MNNKYDLIIVGAGPSGVFTAYELIELGFSKNKRILLVEQGKAVDKRYCPVEKVGKCVKCKPYCNITSGFSGAGAFSDGKLTLPNKDSDSIEVGGILDEYLGVEKTKELMLYTDEIYLKFGADPHLEGLEQLDKIRLAVDEIAKSWEEVKKKSIEAAEAANDYLKKDEQSKLPQNAGTSTSVQSSNCIATKTGPAASAQSWNGAAAKVSTVSFASGGYTGDWGDNNGRIAVLHKKELILNKDDTVNMLNIIDKVREYVNVINSLMTSKISNGTTPQNTSTIVNEPVQQDIHIDANFPNVYNAKEIEEALNNLTNIASQYVNRKDR